MKLKCRFCGHEVLSARLIRNRVSLCRSCEQVMTNAQKATRAAVECGMLAREECFFCGNADTVAHHHDYRHPLRVFWLCRKCHGKVHSIGETFLSPQPAEEGLDDASDK